MLALPTAGHVFTPAVGVTGARSLGLFCYGNTSAFRQIRVRRLEAKSAPRAVLSEAGKWPFDEKEARRRQLATARALGVKVERKLDLGGGVTMAFVLIPAGEFMMGSPPTTSPKQLQKTYGGEVEWWQREFPQHRVKITKPFWLGKTEVTQAQWEAVMGGNPSKFKPRPRNPVEQVNWNDCQGFLQKVSVKFKKPFRLPTEAEWEYACRAGT
ncbi:MAG: formylglycine-generating enzyme family protein, partial [Planctomycetes bacterium]|nr:formylglycine-generating enzyme family protein [Planctomycetota bacterium]